MDEQVAKTLTDFFSQFSMHHFKKGDILLRADDVPQGVFCLSEGSVKMYALSKKGDEAVLNTFKPISFFPMAWAINNSQNDYFYEAVSDVVVWRAPRDEVVAFLKSSPDVLYDLVSRIYRGLDGMLGRMSYLMAGSAYARLITEMLIVAKRFGKATNNGILLSINEQDLASQTGLARETVSREIKKLKEKNLVTLTQNALAVHSIEKLEEELLASD